MLNFSVFKKKIFQSFHMGVYVWGESLLSFFCVFFSLESLSNTSRRAKRQHKTVWVKQNEELKLRHLRPNQHGCNAQWKLSRDIVHSAYGSCMFGSKSYVQSALINNYY